MSEKSIHIAFAADHAGRDMKSALIDMLRQQGYHVTDLGTNGAESVDYPDYGKKLGEFISADKADYGIALCGSGIGISIALNRFEKIRCALCYDVDCTRLARQHNNANVLALGARKIDIEAACEMVKVFLETEFEGGRHACRVEKLGSITNE